MVVRLQYTNGNHPDRLEGFGLETDKLVGSGGLRPGDKPVLLRVRRKDAAGKPNQQEVREPIELTVRERDGALELTFPPGLLDGCRKFEISWIDAYRN